MTRTAIQIINVISIIAKNSTILNKLFFGITSDLLKFHVFGCLYYIPCNKIQRQKIDL